MSRTFSETEYMPELSVLLNRLRGLVEKVESFELTERTPGLLWEHIGEIERWADSHTKDPRSCIDRIEGQYASELEDITSMIGWYNAWSKASGRPAEYRAERARTRIEESILSAEIEGDRLHVQMSWGGPSDGFYADVDKDGTLDNVRYYFKDWFDGAEIHVNDLVVEEYLGFFNSRAW